MHGGGGECKVAFRDQSCCDTDVGTGMRTLLGPTLLSSPSSASRLPATQISLSQGFLYQTVPELFLVLFSRNS